MRLPTLLLSTLLALTASTTARRTSSDSILLSNVKTLTFRSGLSTTHRRVPAIPQLKCIGGAGRGLYEVDVMRCKNAGADYNDEDIQWTCTASLPEEFKLGSTDVVCEGYDGPDDPYVLKGSCGVEYRLALTSKGEEKYGNGRRRTGSGDDDRESTQTDRFVAGAFWFIFIGVILWMLYKAFISPNRDTPGAAPRNWGGYGGGGPGDDDDPPPPYPGTDSRYNKPSGGYGTNNGNQPWRPGFWSGVGLGAGAGGAAGYFAGNRNNTRNGGSSWLGGNGEGSSRSSSSSASPPSVSFSRHESTGFGSTSRR